MLPNRMPKFVLSRDSTQTGIPTGKTRSCQLDGCRGVRIGVRWPDDSITWPCQNGIEFIDKQTDRIM